MLPLLLAVACGLHLPPRAAAQQAAKQNEALSLSDQNEWARFNVGAWKKVRLRRETLDENGKVVATSTTETTTTLVAVHEGSYELRVEHVVEVAGKRFPAEVQKLKRGFYGESNGYKSVVRDIGPGEVEVNGEKIPVQIEKIDLEMGESKRSSTCHRSSEVAPFVLKQRTTVTSTADDSETATIQVDVVALDMPCKVLAETKLGAYVKTIVEQKKGQVVTIEATCEEVPGGVVWHSSKELNEDGVVTRRSTLELVDYDARKTPMRLTGNRRGIFRRRRPRTSQ